MGKPEWACEAGHITLTNTATIMSYTNDEIMRWQNKYAQRGGEFETSKF